eukprot:Gregarina_sp_Pseudo_9__1243@NODE_1822_length_1306_cov_301_313339_g1690_i0_p1_GENE_NODE_1822_length_1306_cov_301_313339_g1690_i0NODE_1822_length_1306_cov_301_313339_g1690_i0_p1_ORF_typecomplete_len217_score18_13_NODE_1822_length_1306_cov_301_313339_g1690_i05251175
MTVAGAASPCLLMSALATTLLLIAHIVTPNRTLSVAINLLCLLICIGSAGVCCLPDHVWRKPLIGLLCVKLAPLWLVTANCSILSLCIVSFGYLFAPPSISSFNNPLSRVIAHVANLPYRNLCWQSSVLLFIAWMISSLSLVIRYREVRRQSREAWTAAPGLKGLLEDDDFSLVTENASYSQFREKSFKPKDRNTEEDEDEESPRGGRCFQRGALV